MPKIVKIRDYNPPNLLGDFSSNDISSASGTDLGSADFYNYNNNNSIRLWLRFKSGNPEDLVKYDVNNTPAITYQGTEEIQVLPVYNSRMQSAKFDNVTNQFALLTFPGGSGNNNIITFGDGAANDLPFSVGFWFRKLPESDGSDAPDYLFFKGKADAYAEYAAWYDPSDDNLYFDLFAGTTSDRQRIYVNASELSDNQWHYLTFTYDGRGTSSGNVPADGMTIYIDSTRQSPAKSPAGTYTYTDGVSELLYIAGVYDGGGGHLEADGNMAEFAIWAKELSLEEIKAIYNWTREDSVVKSGYTNLPPRIRLRGNDNRPGCYPTKHRMGDKDRSGKASIFYEDLPIQFGNEIKDDFTNVPNTDLITTGTGFDSKKWAVSLGMTIRRESIQSNAGSATIDRCATFSGAGISGKRFLRSRQKIRNPYRFYFELLQGPYQTSAILLNLRAGDVSETLKLQIATDTAFTSPITIATYVPTPNPTKEYSLVGPNRKPRRIISLSLSDFPDLGQEYYFRFVQETFSSNKNVWAIANIEVEYANQNIRYPLLLNHSDNAGNKMANAILGNANISGSLTGTGRSVKGISDLGNPFQDFSETISAFNETLVIEKADNEFFNQGLNSDIYPGFSSPTRSKTKFTIDLSPDEETTFGYVDKVSNTYSNVSTDTSAVGQKLMIYWNNNLKKWEKIGQPLHFNNLPLPGAGSDTNNTGSIGLLTESCLGFSSNLRAYGKSDGSGTPVFTEFFNEAALKTSNKKTTTFNFPFGPQYNATGSQTVKAKDLGITKPFLLEKCSIEFKSKLEMYSAGAQHTPQQRAYRIRLYQGDDLSRSDVDFLGIQLITPTFFMLRQFKDNFIFNNRFSGNNISNATIYSSSIEIPGSFKTGQNGTSRIYVDTNRELITYGQIGYFLTSSVNSMFADGYANQSVNDSDGNEITSLNFVEAGLSFDENVIKTLPNENPRRLTGSFAINFNTKYSAKTPSNGTTSMNHGFFYENLGTVSSFSDEITFKNEFSKTHTDLKSSRSIVNNIDSFSGINELIIPDPLSVGVAPTTTTVPNAVASEKISPYVILPEDELILGWQYPPMENPKDESPASDSTKGLYSMTLFGSSKLHLYGSEVVENKEYHETVNQNLTSCAVYEHIIGDEKVVDQWQVAYRGELTGSYSLFIPYKWSAVGFVDSSTQSTQAIVAVGNHYFQHKNNIAFQDPKYKVNDISKINPIQKIGLFSTRRSVNPSEDAFNLAYNLYIKSFSASTSRNFAEFFKNHFKYWASENGITSLAIQDRDRIYVDSTKTQSDFYDDSYYGTYGRADDTPPDGGLYSDRSRSELDSMFSTRFSGYNFNTAHFGYYADMFQQGKDSKFKVTPRQGFTTGFDISVNSSSPVKIQFVSGSFQDDPSIKSYAKKNVETYLDEFHFQSSNLSTAATSSMPFIDDNQTHNRSYLEQEFIAVPIF
jgi:hypothetical protein